MTLTPKPELETNAVAIGEEFRKRLESLITPLTDEELTSVAYFFDEIQPHKKEVRLKSKELKSAPLDQLQHLPYLGIADVNGHKVAIFVKDNKYFKLDMFDMLKGKADLIDRIFLIKLKIGLTVNKVAVDIENFSFAKLSKEIPYTTPK